MLAAIVFFSYKLIYVKTNDDVSFLPPELLTEYILSVKFIGKL
jgi:hypothetical protein